MHWQRSDDRVEAGQDHGGGGRIRRSGGGGAGFAYFCCRCRRSEDKRQRLDGQPERPFADDVIPPRPVRSRDQVGRVHPRALRRRGRGHVVPLRGRPHHSAQDAHGRFSEGGHSTAVVPPGTQVATKVEAATTTMMPPPQQPSIRKPLTKSIAFLTTTMWCC